MAEIKGIDWEAIEIDYRAGIKTLREIAEEHFIPFGSINKRAKRDGWTRDLTAKIKAKAEFLVSQSLVSKEVSKEKRILESGIVEANALDSATIQINERKDVTQARSISMALVNELESQVVDKELYQRLGELMDSPDESLRLLAKEYMAATGRKITPAGIKKHYYVLGTPRNLAGKIKAKAESLVNKELVNELLNTKMTLSESAIVDANMRFHSKGFGLAGKWNLSQVYSFRCCWEILHDLAAHIKRGPEAWPKGQM